ncbi:MAG: hypothetical protein ACRC4M_02085 [Mycoplasma sp.]
MIIVNLIPSNLWNINLRLMLDETEWKKLSLQTREQQNWTCQFCKISINQLKQKKWFHCHELWGFDDDKNEIILSGLLCLCSKCHLATHFGYASIKNKQSESFQRICKVNNWSKEDTEVYLEHSFEIWSQRSTKTWTIHRESLKKNLSPEQYELVIEYIDKNKL